MYTAVSIPKTPGGGAAVAKKDRISIFDAASVATDVVREFGSTSAAGPLTLETGAKGISIQVARSSIACGYEQSGEVDAKVFADRVEFDYPGDSVPLNNFIEAYANKGVIIIVESCDGPTKIYGRKCNPMFLQAEPTDSREGLRTHLTFNQEMGDAYVPRVYTGTIPAVEEDGSVESDGE